tara:strand:+ start:500 stop:1486 length:987 start_codon:yes stop_codon:yes gene_type:complete
MSILNVNKINPVGGGSTITIAGIASVTNNISVGNSVTATTYFGDGSNLTGISVDSTKIETGNTKVETIDTGSDGHVKITTEGTERVRITSSGNVDINGTPPWSVTGGDYRNLSISGQTSSSSGFFWLGNGAAATNADFDLGRINFNNGATITSSIRASTQTSANDDGRITFHTKATGGSLSEKVRISSEGYVTNPTRPAFDVAKDNGPVSSTNAIVFNHVNVNIGSHYNTSNGRFTAPVTGTYFLYYGGIKNNSGSVARVKLLKNGTGNYMNGDRELRMDSNQNYGDNASMNVIVSLTATDYVQVYVTEGTIYGTDSSYTHFGGYLLS